MTKNKAYHYYEHVFKKNKNKSANSSATIVAHTSACLICSGKTSRRVFVIKTTETMAPCYGRWMPEGAAESSTWPEGVKGQSAFDQYQLLPFTPVEFPCDCVFQEKPELICKQNNPPQRTKSRIRNTMSGQQTGFGLHLALAQLTHTFSRL